MNTSDLLSSIDSEIAMLRQVRALLVGESRPHGVGVGNGRKRGTMSAEARARIAAAQRKRWAKQKKAAKKAA
jgi:hypothetical protein